MPTAARPHRYFDFDGTLCDTERDIKDAWRATVDELGLDPAPFREKYVTGPSIDDMVRLMWPDQAGPALFDAVRSAFIRLYDSSGFPFTAPYPGVVARLEKLKKSGARLYVMTNKRYSATCAVVGKLGWEYLFDGIYSSDKYRSVEGVALKKPMLLKRAMEEQRSAARDCAMAGDTRLDIEAARANGVFAIGVAWGYGSREELEAAGADAIVSSPEEL